MDDATAIERCQAGDRHAFGSLVARYQAEAIGHAAAILGDREEALDAVQEAFVRAFKAIGRFAPGLAFYPWLYTILRNHCYTVLRRRSGRRHVALPRDGLLAPAPDESAARETDLLERALAELAAEDRELITLKHLDGLRYEQLAERLGIPSGTVMSRLHHARKRLRETILRLRRSRDATGACDD